MSSGTSEKNQNKDGAGNETRTRDLDLGKVALYQLSYARLFCIYCFGVGSKWCPGPDLNRHGVTPEGF